MAVQDGGGFRAAPQGGPNHRCLLIMKTVKPSPARERKLCLLQRAQSTQDEFSAVKEMKKQSTVVRAYIFFRHFHAKRAPPAPKAEWGL